MLASSSASGNVAGFGARRFQDIMESQRLEQERARWEQHNYEQQQYEQHQYEQHQYEQHQYEQHQYEQHQQEQYQYEQHQYEQHQYEQQQYEQHQYEQQQYEAQYMAQQKAHEEQEHQRAMDEQLELERAQNEHRYQSWSQQQHAQQEHQNHQSHELHHAHSADSCQHPHQQQHWRHNAAASSDSARYGSVPLELALLTEESVRIPSSTSYGSIYGGCYDAGTSSEPSTIDAPVVRRPERETYYDDDFEESQDTDVTRTYHLSPQTICPTDQGARDSSLYAARATVIQPDLPKAKCADCGEKLEFEALADHACISRSGSAMSPFIIQSSPMPDGSVTSFGDLLTPTSLLTPSTPRSPFFDRYQDLIGDTGPMSPAFSTPTTTSGYFDDERAWATKSLTQTPKARETSSEEPMPIVVTVSASESPLTSSYDRPSVQRSISDSPGGANARRKMIEEQRALKKHVLQSAAVVVNQATKPTSPSVVPHSDGHHKTASCSSASTAASSLLDNSVSHCEGRAREGLHTAASDVTNITPSSSYDRLEDSSPPAYPSSMKKKPTHQSRSGSRGRSEIDLSSIEEMMKGLVTSPEPMPKSSRGRSEPSSPRLVATPAPKRTDRERVLEKELERLRERERNRQMQALRLKEKKRREREAKRCCVCDCSLTSSRTPFVERDGKLLCARDWKELYLPKCRKCNLAVEKGAVKSSDGALRGVFHRNCFACAACEAPFRDGSFYVYNNQPYCSRHYHRLNGSLCRECEGGIEGECRQTDSGDKYHPDCFRCQWTSKHGPCTQQLSAYRMISGQRLCQRHAEKMTLKLTKHGASSSSSDLTAGLASTMLRQIT